MRDITDWLLTFLLARISLQAYVEYTVRKIRWRLESFPGHNTPRCWPRAIFFAKK